MDNLTPEQRRKNMQSIKSKDTTIEIMLRKELWKRGWRYRINCKNVFGKPDILFTKQKVAIFCDSEFWHGHDWENRKNNIKTNREYWVPKIYRNIERDQNVNSVLTSQGYTVLRFWESDIRKNVSSCADVIEQHLNS